MDNVIQYLPFSIHVPIGIRARRRTRKHQKGDTHWIRQFQNFNYYKSQKRQHNELQERTGTKRFSVRQFCPKIGTVNGSRHSEDEYEEEGVVYRLADEWWKGHCFEYFQSTLSATGQLPLFEFQDNWSQVDYSALMRWELFMMMSVKEICQYRWCWHFFICVICGVRRQQSWVSSLFTGTLSQWAFLSKWVFFYKTEF